MANDESGYMLFMALFVFAVVMIVGVALIVVGTSEATLSKRYSMMEQAYSNADAGIDRGIMAVAQDVIGLHGIKLSTDTQAGAQWQTQTGGEEFGGTGSSNKYEVTVYQDDLNPSAAYFKKIVSRGTFTWNEKTVRRTIETRCYVPVLGKDYDASFDYCMFNGFNREGGEGTWPGVTFYTGAFKWEGNFAYQGHAPKGAIYTRGNIDLKCDFAGDLKIYGPPEPQGAAMVATGDIHLHNSYELHGLSPAYEVNGNVVAGVDGSGSARAETLWTGGAERAIYVNGNLVAGTDVEVLSNESVNLDNPLSIKGIRAGNNVNVQGSWNISRDMIIGSNGIISGKKTTIASRWTSGITVIGPIYAGQAADGLGVDFDTVAASSITVQGTTTSTGKVDLAATLAGIDMGNIVAGNDTANQYGGTGVLFDIRWLSGTDVDSITSTGMVDLRANDVSTITTGPIDAGTSDPSGTGGTGVIWQGSTLSSIWVDGISHVYARGDIIANMAAGSYINTNNGPLQSGRHVELNGGELLGAGDDSFYLGSVSAKGHVNIVTGDNITANGSVLSEQWVRIWSVTSLFSGINEIKIYGDIRAGSAVIPDFWWYANGVPILNPAPDRLESGWTVYVNDSNDWPLFSDDLITTGTISAAGNICYLGQDHVQTGNIDSNGNVKIGYNYDWVGNSSRYDHGNITAGGWVYLNSDVELIGFDDTINIGAISSGDYVLVRGHDEVRTNSIYANGYVDVRSTPKDAGTGGNPVEINGYIQSRSTVTYRMNTAGVACGDGNGWVSGGIWGAGVDVRHYQLLSGDVSIGNISGNDSIRSQGNVYIDSSGDLLDADIFLGGGSGDIRYNGSCDIPGDVDYGSAYGGYSGLPTAYTHPSVSAPTCTNPTVPLKPRAPDVGHGTCPGDSQPYDVDLLTSANLDEPVRVLEPSWGHFRDKAMKDDAAGVGPHMIKDSGLVSEGDHDLLANNGEIAFWWTSDNYSSNETVYNDDSNVTVVIKKLIFPGSGNFSGTIVSRGSVYIDASETDWFVGSNQELNIAAGEDIVRRTSGFSIWENANCHFHFYAYRNIDLTNMRFQLGASMVFYGSFTAGNRVYWRDNTVFMDVTFRWSRWALDPAGWAPPFKVLSWREV